MVWQVRDLPSGGYSSPVVAKGRVYVYIHANHEKKDVVVCLDERTGAAQWQTAFPLGRVEGDEASGTPCIVGDLCLVQGGDSSYCLNAATGALVWKADPGVPTNMIPCIRRLRSPEGWPLLYAARQSDWMGEQARFCGGRRGQADGPTQLLQHLFGGKQI